LAAIQRNLQLPQRIFSDGSLHAFSITCFDAHLSLLSAAMPADFNLSLSG